MTIEPHAARFQFGTAVPQQGNAVHPATAAVIAKTISVDEFFQRAPFLDFPNPNNSQRIRDLSARLLAKHEATIGYDMLTMARAEGHHRGFPGSLSQAKAYGARDTAAAARRAGALEFIAANPWSGSMAIGEHIQAHAGTVTDMLNPMIVEGLVIATLHNGRKIYAMPGTAPFDGPKRDNSDLAARVLDALQSGPLSTTKIHKAAGGCAYRLNDTLDQMEKAGRIVGSPIRPSGTLWHAIGRPPEGQVLFSSIRSAAQ